MTQPALLPAKSCFFRDKIRIFATPYVKREDDEKTFIFSGTYTCLGMHVRS